MKIKKLNYPFTKEKISKLKTGDMVLISGKLFTGRDAIHKYLHEGNKSPVNLNNQIIYHCGPVVIEDKKTKTYIVKAAGPTTSIREEPYQWQIIRDHKILAVIGKGGMGEKTLKACRDYTCIYLHAIGGAAQVLAEKIISVDNVYLKEKFGSPEAIWELTVSEFPAVVTMDSHGNSLHCEVENESLKRLKNIL